MKPRLSWKSNGLYFVASDSEDTRIFLNFTEAYLYARTLSYIINLTY